MGQARAGHDTPSHFEQQPYSYLLALRVPCLRTPVVSRYCLVHPSAYPQCPQVHLPCLPAPPHAVQASSPTLVSCHHMARLKPAFAELLLPHAFADLAVQPGSGALALELGAAMRRELLPRLHRHPKAARLLLGCLNHLRSQYLDAKLGGSGSGGGGAGGRSKSRAGSAGSAAAEIELWRKVGGDGAWNRPLAMQICARKADAVGRDRCPAQHWCQLLVGSRPWARSVLARCLRLALPPHFSAGTAGRAGLPGT